MSETRTLTARQYEQELLRLQTELVYMQEWIVTTGHRLVVLFEGRDTAGKDGVIKRDHHVPEPAHLSRRRAAHTHRARAHAVVLPALRRPPAGSR